MSLTSADPEPPIGSEVIDASGLRWEHVEGTYSNHYWIRTDSPDGDPESWYKVAGNYGPVRLVWTTADLRTGEVREEASDLRPISPEEFLR